jgi:hypothetical protein
MKKTTLLNIVIGIGLLAYLVYQIWDTTQNSKNEASFKPDYIRGTINHSEVLRSLDSVTAYEIANCFYDKFVQKYGRKKLIELDNKAAAGDTSVYKEFAEPILDSCIKPYDQKVKEARYMNNCIHSFTKKKRPEAQRRAFCNCFLEKEKLKYGNNFEDSARGDSLLKIELIQSGCADELNK